MEYTAGYNRHYPYPMLDSMTPAHRSLFYLFQIPTLIALYHAANGIHRLVRGREATDRKGPVEAGKVRKAERVIEDKAQ